MLSLLNFSPIQVFQIATITAIVAFIVSIVNYFVKRYFDSVESKKTRFKTNIEILRDNDIDSIEKIIYEIRDLSCKYWSQDLTTNQLLETGASIIGRFGYMGYLFERLFGEDINKLNEMGDLLGKLHTSCTGQDFLSKHRKLNPRLLQDIEQLTYVIIGTSIRLRRELAFEQNK